MASIYTLLSVSLLCSIFGLSKNQNNITTTNLLRDPDTLVSNNGFFEMGFFGPANSSNRYLAIWYHDRNDNNDALEVVWVANRDNPLNDSSGVLRISEFDGNLQLLNAQNKIFWSSDVNLGANNRSVAQLQDTGNLVLLGNASASGNVLWQSFDHPTNTLLPQMKLTITQKGGEKHQLRSWMSDSNPSNGRFTIGISLENQLTEGFIWVDDHPYWRTGPWNGIVFIGVPLMNSVLLDGFNLGKDDEGEYSLSFSLSNQSILTHYVLSSDGIFKAKDWDYGDRRWTITWSSLGSDCDMYGYCGQFGNCNSRNSPICSCLKGFVPKNKEEWSKGNWSSGCVRRTPLQCESKRGRIDGFLKLINMKTPANAIWISSDDEEDCGSQCLGKCQCLAYAFYEGVGCMIWNTSLIDLQEFPVNAADLFIRLADAELGKTSKVKIILVVLLVAGTISIIVMCFVWRWKNRRNVKKIVSEFTPMHHNMFNPNMSQVELQDQPLFTFEKLVIATNNFQDTNKLGRGGFGPVYKGTLEDGQEIAVKRLARTSGQGIQEFMNEVVVISKLQHMNLVKLLGCCVEGDEKMLVYEYMPNKSLNAILFDPLKKENLDWKTRFNIIEGICRGLLYLHRDSRLRIIHRDLKASNILLDKDLNPKISDFGMARIFDRNEDQANTLRVVGTYGYMSPEYAMNGCFSEKSDVFSFGVLLLEIISGKSISSFVDDDCLGLLGYAWKLWKEDNILPFVDAIIFNPHVEVDILRCMQLALLCTQEFPEERPTISSIISMLHCDIATLPHPNQPGFTQKRSFPLDEFQWSCQQYHSVNHISLTSIGAR